MPYAVWRWVRCRGVAPVRERGLKSYRTDGVQPVYAVAPVRERGLKYQLAGCHAYKSWVAPVRERGLKFHNTLYCGERSFGRSREGAWIEIVAQALLVDANPVAPVRERGLK